MREWIEFCCPDCGSHYWGTSWDNGGAPDLTLATGYCAGMGNRGVCKYTWPRTNDHEVFVVVRHVGSAEELRRERLRVECDIDGEATGMMPGPKTAFFEEVK